ncbi:restriction endonuclease subunit S [Klebsiella quasipneumoniae]|uniref:restriction endonuclease subunit S n=1 Tax=Klebsiella quasipneumoniae TaxID=1463165 RepID=UPI001E3B8245|nr:restriction endonuclease subunit S [Klebsiella quasipneumoniae]MCD7063165.1 restriction endonuclease subunit S [Klebsiella quasipneumoniae subsp. similipneumoniae]MEB6157133.1 restriction endonuclease subunit S [Klebsiella quasipneumoniae]
MAKYKAYPEYKDSGVKWLDKLPLNWSTEKTKRMFSLKRNLVGHLSGSFQLLSLTLNGVVPRDISSGEGKIPASFDTYQSVQAGDLIFCLFDIDETPRTIGLAEQDGMITGAYNVYSCMDKCLPSYAYYYFLHIDSFKGLKPFYTGLRKVVRAETFGCIEMPNPSLSEQEKICLFLDHETAKIDNLIEKQQQLIELLKEKRQAVISHAVTKGLNPDVPMKDSGVEWLGYIPEHWERSRIGWMCNVGNGCTPSRENTLYWQNGSYPWLNSSKVNDERVLIAEQFVTTKAMYECSLPIVKKGSVIMAITGEGKTRGTSALMMINATISQHVAYITPRKNDKISAEFIHLWLQSKYQQIRTNSEGWGSTKAAITCSDVKYYPIPVPPLKEQTEIVRAIEEKKAIFTNLLLSCEKEIEILQERRTALISAAVTGKIDVRDWVALDTQDVEESQEATA